MAANAAQGADKKDVSEANNVLGQSQEASRQTTHAFGHFKEQQLAKVEFLRKMKAKQMAAASKSDDK